MIFSKAEAASLKLIKKMLKDFALESGLSISQHKNALFIAGLEDDQMLCLCQMMGIQLGKLLVKYLGVPLSAQKLGVQAYSGLTDRITARISS